MEKPLQSILAWNSSLGIYYRCYIITYSDSHLHTCTYICRIIHNDTMITTPEGQRRTKTSLQKYIPLTLFVRFERVVQGLHVKGSWRPNINCNFLTPLLWPSRCVFLVLLMLGFPPSGFPRTPSVGCGFPYHIWSLAVWTLLATASWTITQLG